MSIQLTIDQLTGPISAGLASASGRFSAPQGMSSISVKFRDGVGTEVTANAALVAGTGTLDGPVVGTDSSIAEPGHWNVTDIDVSTLVPGPVLVLVTATDVASAQAFDAASTSISGATRHVTYQPWSDHTVLDRLERVYDPIDPALVDDCCWIASDILFRLTGSRWPGVGRMEKLRPQAKWRQYDRPQWWQNANWMPTRTQSFSRYGWCSCNRGRDYGCNTIPEIQLPYPPIIRDSIIVMIDGNQFDGWDLRDGVWLQRTDGQGFPCCQKTWLPDTEVSTWSVSFSHGLMPDYGGVVSSAILGLELAKAYTADEEHPTSLSNRVRSYSRGGTTVQMNDPSAIFGEGLTGIPEVDLWLLSPQIAGKRMPSTIHAVGKMPRYRTEG